ncbi:hypothetical protein KIH74_16905 [Kineosporia sp. J2-2]|uniref:Uncharacterized protein n=1 Tax=Kineosporia corallincola TaxID=2835133 RepID=A0ABS5THQ2_9ACTN|nr:hypothetical protein [Kineosporia corallincola]MBT0770625.1 hypothetical protein [Kineosporia corallincola]
MEEYIRAKFAEYSGLSEAELFAPGATLASVLAASPRMTNSLDLMEALARTSNAVRKDHGVRVRLPALPLNTPTTEVLAAFLEEYDKQAEGAA